MSFKGLLTASQLNKVLRETQLLSAEDTATLFKAIRDLLYRKPDGGDVELPFGKYKGQMVSVIAGDDYRYLKWLYGEFDKEEEYPALYEALCYYCNKKTSGEKRKRSEDAVVPK